MRITASSAVLRDAILDPGYPVLQCGQSRSFGSITFARQETGRNRTDSRVGHYFRLASDNYELH